MTMPWRVRIRRRDWQPLGEFSAVLGMLSEALPEAFAYRAPRRAGECWVDYVDDELTVRFVVAAEPEVDRVEVQVRGTGNPMPVLARLVRLTEWTVEEPSGRPVNVRSRTVRSWRTYLESRQSLVAVLRTARVSQVDVDL